MIRSAFLKKVNRRKLSSEFARNTGLVLIGTLVAQVLPLLFYPVFTRLYTPAEFGTFAIVSMIATPLAIVASGVYEQAFLVIESKRPATNLFVFIVLRSLAVLLISMAGLVLFRSWIATALGDPALVAMLLLVPLIAFGQVIYNCTSEWLVREKAFKALAGNRIWQSGSLALAKLGFGIGGWTHGGLVLGEATARLAYIVSAFWVWRHPLRRIRPIRWRRVAATGKRYRGFPRLMVPDQLLSTFGGSIHIPLIGLAFGPTELGYVSILFSALYLPITIVSSSVKDVFRQRASVDYARDKDCRPLYVRLLLAVSFMGLVGFGLLYFISPWVFVLVFGPKWAAVGTYAQLLVPVFFFNFVAMSLGGVLVIANQMAVSVRWQVTNLAASLIGLLVGMFVIRSVEGALVGYSTARSFSYIHYMVLSYKHAKLDGASAALMRTKAKET